MAKYLPMPSPPSSGDLYDQICQGVDIVWDNWDSWNKETRTYHAAILLAKYRQIKESFAQAEALKKIQQHARLYREFLKVQGIDVS